MVTLMKKLWNKTIGSILTLWINEENQFAGISLHFRFGGPSSQHSVKFGHWNNYLNVKNSLKEKQ